MRFDILGPLAVQADDGTPLSLARPSQRSTLVVLLLNAGQHPTRAVLFDALWGDNPPRAADAALRVRMRDLRRALAGQDRLLTHQAGYRIVVRPGELDADVFRNLLSRGRAALDDGSAEDAARLLAQACRLWRDPPLADFPDTPLVRLAGAELLEQRRDAREWLVDARLALGQHREVLAEVRALIAADPLREHPHAQLMLALYRCGQKAAALDAYSRLRDLTARELGQDPGPEARGLLAQVLTESPDLRFRPRALAVSSDPRPAWTPVCQLPAPLPDFTGRVVAIEALARSMPAAEVAVTVITGPPAAGKTALAVRAAHLASDSFPDGQLYVGLGGPGRARDPADALGELLRSLGVPAARVPADIAERAALYRSVLAGRRVLLLADDAANAAQVRPLLPGAPGSAVLVTSSIQLADLEGASRVSIGGLSTQEAVTLLGKIAGAGRVAAEPDAAAAIAAACGGLPLALRIAGARLAASPALRLADLAAAVSDNGRLLGELVIGDLSVRRRLDATWRALDPTSREALRTLATLAEGGLGVLPGSLVHAATDATPAAARTLTDSCLIIEIPETGDYEMAPLAACHAVAQPAAS